MLRRRRRRREKEGDKKNKERCFRSLTEDVEGNKTK
jgi:hypothetical protein